MQDALWGGGRYQGERTGENVMPIVIAVVAYLCLGLHSYLNYFWVKESLPYSFGFALFLKVEWLLIMVNSIYLLGWLWGVVAFLVALLGAGVLSFPISFLCHVLTPQSEMQKMVLGERPAPILYGGWSVLVLILGALTVINLFITPSRTGLHVLTSYVHSLSSSTLAWMGAVCCLLVYFLIGVATVVRDYSTPLVERPLYAIERAISITLFNVFLWPVSLIARKVMDGSLRRRDR